MSNRDLTHALALCHVSDQNQYTGDNSFRDFLDDAWEDQPCEVLGYPTVRLNHF